MCDHQRVLMPLKGGVVRSCPVWLDHVSILDLEKITSKLHHCYVSGLGMWHLFGSGKKNLKNESILQSDRPSLSHQFIYASSQQTSEKGDWRYMRAIIGG